MNVIVGHCLNCGAPIYGPDRCEGVIYQAPPVAWSCMCQLNLQELLRIRILLEQQKAYSVPPTVENSNAH